MCQSYHSQAAGPHSKTAGEKMYCAMSPRRQPIGSFMGYWSTSFNSVRRFLGELPVLAITLSKEYPSVAWRR